MFPIRIKACSESDLRMLGNLARNIQRVLPVTQADIDAAAALGKGWVVWKVIEVNDPIDNLRGGTQLVIKQNSITPGQNVRRVLIVSGPGGETVVIGPGPSPLLLPDAIANSLSYVKAFGGTEQRNLPSGYTALEYIESTGTQYIDTGYFFTDIATETVTIDFMRTGTGAGSLLYGTRKAYKDNGYAIQFQDSGNTYIQYGEIDNGLGSQNKGSLNTRYTLTQTGPTYNFNGGSYTSTGATPTQSYSLYLFTTNNGGSPSAITPMRVYSFVIKDSNNNIKLNLVPAQNSSGVIGMYDTVSGTFFTNAGTGDFVAGPDAVPTPTAPIDIVCNNGVLKASGNLINLTTTTDGYYYQPNGTYTESSPSRLTDYIPVKAGQKYTVYYKTASTTQSQISVRINFFNSSKVWQSQEVLTLPAGAEDVKTITATIDGYVRISANSYSTTGLNADWNTAQMVSGEYTVATMPTYHPYGEIYTDGTVETIGDTIGNTATAEMLLKVGDYQDVQSVIDGVVTRKVGIKVLDGTENWMTGTGGVWYNFQGSVGAFNTTIVICSHYSYAGAQVNIVDMSQNQFSSYSNGNIAFKSAETTSADDFKTWLADKYNAGTPVMVVYAKTTSATESVTGQTLQVQEGNNTLEITQASLSNLELEAEYQKRT